MLARVALASAIPARNSFSISIRRPPGAGVVVGEGTPTPAALLAAFAALVTPLLTVFRPVLMSCQHQMVTAISKGRMSGMDAWQDPAAIVLVMSAVSLPKP